MQIITQPNGTSYYCPFHGWLQGVLGCAECQKIEAARPPQQAVSVFGPVTPQVPLDSIMLHIEHYKALLRTIDTARSLLEAFLEMPDNPTAIEKTKLWLKQQK